MDQNFTNLTVVNTMLESVLNEWKQQHGFDHNVIVLTLRSIDYFNLIFYSHS